jgi:hypothetical protein
MSQPSVTMAKQIGRAARVLEQQRTDAAPAIARAH